MNDIQLPPAPPLPPEVRRRALHAVRTGMDAPARGRSAPVIAAAAVVVVIAGGATAAVALRPAPTLSQAATTSAPHQRPDPGGGVASEAPAPVDGPGGSGTESVFNDCVRSLPVSQAPDSDPGPEDLDPPWNVVGRVDAPGDRYVLSASRGEEHVGLCVGENGTGYWTGARPAAAPPPRSGSVLHAARSGGAEPGPASLLDRVVLVAVGAEVARVEVSDPSGGSSCPIRSGLALCVMSSPTDGAALRFFDATGRAEVLAVPVEVAPAR